MFRAQEVKSAEHLDFPFPIASGRFVACLNRAIPDTFLVSATFDSLSVTSSCFSHSEPFPAFWNLNNRAGFYHLSERDPAACVFCGGYPMFSKLMDAMFGCRHARYSFPITVRAGVRHRQPAQRVGTYVACLDCGQEFRYDWQEMKIIGSQAKEIAQSALLTKEAA